jgi:ubiquinone/menaquinone biosynthesis C-methylase UbiE
MGMEKAKEHSRNAFNRKARRYEETLAGWHSEKMKKAALACLTSPVQGALLDVGCGPGLLLATLAAQYPELKLAGLDIAPEMVRVATERLGKRADVRVGDSEAPSWQDGSFDYVVCVDSFHHYPNPQRALSEFHRVLKSRGHLILADPTAPSLIRKIVNPLNRLLRNGDVKMYDRQEITEMLTACKFEESEWHVVGRWGFVATAVVR